MTAPNFCPDMPRDNMSTKKYCFEFRKRFPLEKALEHIGVDIFWNAGCIVVPPSAIPI